MIDRCSGDCCRRFMIRVSPQELADSADELELRNDGFAADLSVRTFQDGVWLADSLVHLGRHAFDPASGRQTEWVHHYTCRHFADGQCTVYEDRPRMCRQYPSHRCAYPGCTWRAARDGRVIDGVAVSAEKLVACLPNQ